MPSMSVIPPQTFVREHALDAIVVVPGIMGSVLKDAERGVIWGFRDPMTYLSLWGPGLGMTPLGFTPAELDALAESSYNPATARVQPAGLIRFPAFAPFVGGFEPYTRLVRALKDVVAHPDAVLEFAYDWRLPTRLNSRLLAIAMKGHLSRWRATEAHTAARRDNPHQRAAEIIIVAHSMGGLVARGLGDPGIENGFENVRQVITLGTPFYGSVKAAVAVERGEGLDVPLPHRRLREVAHTMPGLYDLLPRNRCLLRRAGGVDEVAALTTDDVVAIGGDRLLADASATDYLSSRSTVLPDHRPILGVAQPTWQSFQINRGTVNPAFSSYRWDAHNELVRDEIGRPRLFDDQGDGTVWRYSARPRGGPDALPVAQQHGALAKSGEVIQTVVALVTDQGDLGIRLGGGEVGLAVPDTVSTHTRFTVTVTGETDPALVTCSVIDVGTNDLVRRPSLRRSADGLLQDTLELPQEGLYRVEVKAGAGEPVTQILMVARPE